MVELLAPAGSPEALDAAISEGADAVYLGLKSFNARMRSSNFSWGQFQAAVDVLHKKGKKIYVTVNTLLTEAEAEQMYRFLAFLNEVGPDAIIVQDFGIVQMAHRYFPKLTIHASTQMNIGSAKATHILSRSGVSRIVLPRETSLAEIEALHMQTSCELEVFVHGAVCVAESGLCLFSSFLGGKSANRGMCTQACRRLYTAHTPTGDRSGYFFSPHDLQLINYMPQLINAGVVSFKIEGRMKSADYVGTVVSAYRYVIDEIMSGGNTDRAIADATRILQKDFARKKTSFWVGGAPAEQVLNPHQAGGTGLFLGTIAETRPALQKAQNGDQARHAVRLEQKSDSNDDDAHYTVQAGDSLRIHSKKDTDRQRVKISAIEERNGETWFDVPEIFGVGHSVYLLQTQDMRKRYPHILPRSLDNYRLHPKNETLPRIEFVTAETPKKAKKSHGRKTESFAEGAYVQVSRVRDAMALRENRLAGIIINLNEETLDDFLAGSLNFPVKKDAIWLSLDPFFSQNDEAELADILDFLIDDGYTHFVANNPGHLSLLKNRGVTIMAGPYLYAFNRYATDWLFENGVEYLCSAHENSQHNLEATADPSIRNRVLVPVFSYPPLFRMRLQLPQEYDFTYFSDKGGEAFRAFSTPSASFVLPEKPFVIFDALPKLKKNGFNRFLIDYSHTVLQQRDFRHLWEFYSKMKNPSNVSRFNWKEGFYDPVKVEALKQRRKNVKR